MAKKQKNEDIFEAPQIWLAEGMPPRKSHETRRRGGCMGTFLTGSVGCFGLMLIVCLGSVMLVAFLGFVAEQSKVEASTRHSFPLTDTSAPVTLQLELGTGKIKIFGADTDRITIETTQIVRSVTHDRATAAISKMEIDITDTIDADGQLLLSSDDKVLDFEGLMPVYREVEIVITVPHELALTLRATNENIQIEDLDTTAPLMFEVTSGKINLENIITTDTLTLKATSGKIELQDIEVGGTLSVTSTSGKIDFDTVTAQELIAVSTSNGNLELQNVMPAGDLVIKTTSGNVEFVGDLGDTPTAEYQFTSTSGKLEIVLADDDNFYLVLESVSGAVENELTANENSTQQTCYGNTLLSNTAAWEKCDELYPRLTIETASGAVTLNIE